ncbi:ABC transporter permease [Geojedonia litorea]|uniref:ABC transporter permease n=1 Tax=Geojedonia litorea TaxID=1268269 RepID=A0ABV9N9D3_9FLAO
MNASKKLKSKAVSFIWISRMAWRDGKASWNKLLLFMASIILGIAAVVAIQSFGDNVRHNIVSQSKSLMGSDFKIDTDKPPKPELLAVIDSLGGADAKEISFPSMAAFKDNDLTKLVRVRGIEGAFPFYGSINTDPKEAAQNYQLQGTALVDATLMLQFQLKPGDSIKIGNIVLPIGGALKSVPGSSSFFSAVAPPVLIPYRFIEPSGLVQTGSRIDYDFYFKALPKTDLDALDDRLDPKLDLIDADIDTHTSTSRRLGRRYENFGKFLNLVAFIALLLGCVGIASAIHIYIKQKLPAVAILKCLGATRRQTFLIFLFQIAVMGLIGGIIGTALGLGLQYLFPLLLEGLLPLNLEINVSVKAIFIGLSLGLSMSVLFALYPLMGTLHISPLQTLRVQEEKVTRSLRSGLLVVLGIILFIFTFSYWLLERVSYSAMFVAGIVVTFFILGSIATLFMNAVKKFFPHSFGFIARQSLLNLYRPQNQTIILVLAIGVGSFLISTLYFSKDLLLQQATLEDQSNSPNIFMLDIQSEQKEAVEEGILVNKLPVIDNIPIVTMRIESLNGEKISDIKKDTTSQVNRWILNHEFRVTYRDSLIASESLVKGTLPESMDSNTPIPISVSDNFIEDSKLNLGDEITFNVQGVLINTVIGSIRTVDWSRMQLNFMIVFPESVLENAPQFRVISTKVNNEKESAQLQQQMVSSFPNISIIDIQKILDVVQDLLSKISWIINFMAFFSILTGVIVLIGAVRTSKHQRIKESVLLRTLGAKNRQIIKIMTLEYIYLGVLGSLSGILLSLIGSQLLAWGLFDAVFKPSWIPFIVIFPAIAILVIFIGMTNSIGVVKSSPLEVLRKENK